MAQAGRTFRIFVSSTFTDLKAERNALQAQVFPKLRELCQRHGCRFQAIDLRWGVRDEAALDQQTMRICLEEIARCQRVTPKPNFIVLLGDRYGWCPLPFAIPADEFEEITRRVSADELDLLKDWDWRDDNAEHGQPDAAGADRLRKLKGRLESLLPGNIDEYDAGWQGDRPTLDHIGTLPADLDECLKLNELPHPPRVLCVDVWRRLSRVI